VLTAPLVLVVSPVPPRKITFAAVLRCGVDVPLGLALGLIASYRVCVCVDEQRQRPHSWVRTSADHDADGLLSLLYDMGGVRLPCQGPPFGISLPLCLYRFRLGGCRSPLLTA
jgi:hypothetical protein